MGTAFPDCRVGYPALHQLDPVTQGVELLQEADESTTGPGSFLAVDPDGTPILVDQHV